MPALPTITDVHRVTMNITSATLQPVHNVFHVRTNAPESAPDVGAALSTIFSMAALDNLLQCLPTAYSLTSLEVLPLNGTTAGHTEVAGASWPAGLQTGDVVPEAAVVITLRTLLRGPSGRGRAYVGPITESAIANGVPTAAMVTTMTTAWANLVAQIILSPLGMEMVVASYTHAIANAVTQAVGKPYAGIQKRRLVRLR